MDKDRQREGADGRESVSLFNQGVHLDPQLAAGQSHQPGCRARSRSGAILSLPRRLVGDLNLDLLTPYMPSRDPHHHTHDEPSPSRALHQSMRAVVWWFALLRRAQLLRENGLACASTEDGYRTWLLAATAEDLEMRIPKLRAGSFFPSLYVLFSSNWTSDASTWPGHCQPERRLGCPAGRNLLLVLGEHEQGDMSSMSRGIGMPSSAAPLMTSSALRARRWY
jgi:hypothetical protein